MLYMFEQLWVYTFLAAHLSSDALDCKNAGCRGIKEKKFWLITYYRQIVSISSTEGSHVYFQPISVHFGGKFEIAHPQISI